MHSGPPDARIMIVGEAPGQDEERLGKPFMGVSGHALNQMLSEAGLNRDACFCTNVCNVRPIGNDITTFFHTAREAKLLNRPERNGRFPNNHVSEGLQALERQIERVQPNVILAVGDTALWALTGLEGITKWRGSELESLPFCDRSWKVIPTYHPASVLRTAVQRPIAIQDMRRARRNSEYPEIKRQPYEFLVAPTYHDAFQAIHSYMDAEVITVDIETRNNQIACIGFARSKTEAFCIPLLSYEEGSYWSLRQEEHIIMIMKELMQKVPCIFHNAIFDVQYIAKKWGFLPRITHDTMLMQHVAFPGLMGGRIDPVTGTVSKKGSSLSLGFIASMYNEFYRFWKDDGRNFDPSVDDEEQLWRYNCEDCVRTFECYSVLTNTLKKLGLWECYEFEMGLFPPVIKMMFRGFNIDLRQRYNLAMDMELERVELKRWMFDVLGFELNMNSPPQMKDVFYGDFKCAPILHRKTRQPTLDDDALEVIRKKNPLLVPIIKRIQRFRSLGVLRSTFALAPLSKEDMRLRCCINIPGVETFRFSANETAFEEGTNLQNIPKEVEAMK